MRHAKDPYKYYLSKRLQGSDVKCILVTNGQK